METSLRKSLLQLWASPCQKSERVKLSLALSSHRNHLHQTQLFSSYLGNNFHQIFGHLLIFHLRPHQKGKYPSDCSLCLLFCATLTPAACAKSSLSCSASVRLGLTLRGLTASYTNQLCCSTAGSRLTAFCWVFWIRLRFTLLAGHNLKGRGGTAAASCLQHWITLRLLLKKWRHQGRGIMWYMAEERGRANPCRVGWTSLSCSCSRAQERLLSITRRKTVLWELPEWITQVLSRAPHSKKQCPFPIPALNMTHSTGISRTCLMMAVSTETHEVHSNTTNFSLKRSFGHNDKFFLKKKLQSNCTKLNTWSWYLLTHKLQQQKLI